MHFYFPIDRTTPRKQDLHTVTPNGELHGEGDDKNHDQGSSSLEKVQMVQKLMSEKSDKADKAEDSNNDVVTAGHPQAPRLQRQPSEVSQRGVLESKKELTGNETAPEQ